MKPGLAGAGLGLAIGVIAVWIAIAPSSSAASADFALVPVSPNPADAALDDSRCASCHQFEPVLSHPIGMAPAHPHSLPLVNGRISCGTCHDAPATHGSEADRVGVRSTPRGLCLECHDSKTQDHANSGAIRAHLGREGQGSRGSAALDAESSSCLSCHDEALAQASPHLSESHPIGPKARLDRGDLVGDVRLAQPDSIDRRVRVFGQAVGCGSCHSLYSQYDNLLVMSNRKSRLCLTCHLE